MQEPTTFGIGAWSTFSCTSVTSWSPFPRPAGPMLRTNTEFRHVTLTHLPFSTFPFILPHASWQVLGTFITEWDEGRVMCGEILHSMESVQLYAQQLARICEFYQFDGWLVRATEAGESPHSDSSTQATSTDAPPQLNIENSVAADRIPLLLAFVSTVRSATRALCPSAQVIWYDSVTDEGELAWQNALTPRNQCFFKAADALFTNYSWVVGEDWAGVGGGGWVVGGS